MAQFKLTVDMDNGIPWMYQNIKDLNGNIVGKYAQKAD